MIKVILLISILLFSISLCLLFTYHLIQDEIKTKKIYEGKYFHLMNSFKLISNYEFSLKSLLSIKDKNFISDLSSEFVERKYVNHN